MDESIRTSEYSCIGQLSAILLHNMSSSNNMYIQNTDWSVYFIALYLFASIDSNL